MSREGSTHDGQANVRNVFYLGKSGGGEEAFPVEIATGREDDTVVPRDAVSDELPHSAETHKTVVSALVLVVAVGCDCNTALDTPLHVAEAAASLRISSIVTLFAMSSPSIVKHYVVDQRVFLGMILVFLSFYGDHYGSLYTRIGDVVYTLFVLLAGVQFYNVGGSAHNRQAMSGLCGSLFFYVGLRGLRAAFYAAQEAVDYKVYYTVNDSLMSSPGYSYMSTSITVPLALGHGVITGIGLVISLHGAFEVGASGVAASIAALWNSIGYSGQLDTLRTLYGPMACSGDIDICKEAYRARRFAISNGSPSGLWLAALAACIFSFSTEKRDMKGIVTSAFGKETILLAAACIAVLTYASTEGEQWHTDVCAVVALLGVFVGFTSNTLLGTILYTGAHGYEEIELILRFGASRVFSHLTHCTLFLMIVLMLAHLAISTVKALLQRCWNVRKESLINTTLAFLATFGTSLASGLYIASAILIASSNGALPEDLDSIRNVSGARTMIGFVANHFLPFYAWIPLYARRCEVQMINSYKRAVAWIMALPCLLLTHATMMALLDATAPTAVITETKSALLLGGVGFVSWAAAAFL